MKMAEGLVAEIAGRYALYGEIASGGMASVHYGRLVGPVGFSRTVAIKRPHPHFAKDRDFARMILDEARVAARIRHPNVVPTLDVVEVGTEIFLVMEYVHGESLSRLARAAHAKGDAIPLDVMSAIMCGVLHGLHAAHEATDEAGRPLQIVHRDVSPQNVLVGADGVPRVLDFGVAKAIGRLQTTREGQVKGKIPYMAPEQIRGQEIDRRTDIYAAGIVMWELLTQQALFDGDNEGELVLRVLERVVEPPSALAFTVPADVDAVVLRALSRDRTKRFATAREMALALEEIVPVASATRVSAWVEELAAERLASRATAVARIEAESRTPTSIPTMPATPAHGRTISSAAAAATAAAATAAAAPAPPADPPSQVSSVALTASATPPAPGHPVSARRGRWGLVAAGVGGACLALALAAGLRASAQGPPAAPGPTSAPPAAATTPPHGEAPVAASSAAPPPAPEPPPPALSATASMAQTPPPAPPPRRVAPHGTGAAASPKSAPSVASSGAPCTIRTFVDSAGIQHFVRDCR
jgi:eukaryotic-like serine/threonine-protein kinase